MHKAAKDSLKENDVCITFDDNLLCQYDIAIPVLNKRKITAFYFAYTSPVEGKLEKLEVYRHFRHSKFGTVEEFYTAFFDAVESCWEKWNISGDMESVNPGEYLAEYPFYTAGDRKFRYYRDVVLGVERYYRIMDEMLREYNYDVKENAGILWCGAGELKKMSDDGHIIGLHSHTHPTKINSLSFEKQYEEYSKNKDILESCTGRRVATASYPCGSTNQDTVPIMKKLGIEIAFKERLMPAESRYMLQREDHSNIFRGMKDNENHSFYK